MSDIESLIVKEANRQGVMPNETVVRQASIDLAGASLTPQGLINLPGRGAISPADFTRSLRATMPGCFSPLDAEPVAKPTTTLTERYKSEIEANRRKQSAPDDWHSVRSRYADGSITASHMDEIALHRQARGN